MIVTSATLRGSDLILSLANPLDAGKVLSKFNSGNYELRRIDQKRSLDANAYAWVLIYKIADKMGLPPDDVYRQYIRDLGCKVTLTTVTAEDAPLEMDSFVSGHIGRQVLWDDHSVPGYVVLHKKYGSSNYNRAEMARFIDSIVQDCEALGIETKDQGYIDSLLGKWGDGDEH